MDTKLDMLKDFAEEIDEEADGVYAHLNQVLKRGQLTQMQKDRVLDYVHAKISALGIRLAALCGSEGTEMQLYNNDEHLDALLYLQHAIHGPRARANPRLKSYLEDLFYCASEDTKFTAPGRIIPMWVLDELILISSNGLDESRQEFARYNRNKHKDLKKRARR